MNLGANSAGGEVLLFLNDDIEALDIGSAGAKLVYPTRALQPAGITIGIGDVMDADTSDTEFPRFPTGPAVPAAAASGHRSVHGDPWLGFPGAWRLCGSVSRQSQRRRSMPSDQTGRLSRGGGRRSGASATMIMNANRAISW
jgi:hypothetical protein